VDNFGSVIIKCGSKKKRKSGTVLGVLNNKKGNFKKLEEKFKQQLMKKL